MSTWKSITASSARCSVADGSPVQIRQLDCRCQERNHVAYCGTASVPAGQPEAAGGAVEIRQ